jgi:hypothetical protein
VTDIVYVTLHPYQVVEPGSKCRPEDEEVTVIQILGVVGDSLNSRTRVKMLVSREA